MRTKRNDRKTYVVKAEIKYRRKSEIKHRRKR